MFRATRIYEPLRNQKMVKRLAVKQSGVYWPSSYLRSEALLHGAGNFRRGDRLSMFGAETLLFTTSDLPRHGPREERGSECVAFLALGKMRSRYAAVGCESARECVD